MTQAPSVIPERITLQLGALTLAGLRHVPHRPTGLRVLMNRGFSDSRIGPGRAPVQMPSQILAPTVRPTGRACARLSPADRL